MLRNLIPFWRPYRLRILWAVLGTAAVTVLSLTPPMVLRRIMDDVFTPRQWGFLVPLVLLYATLPVMSALVGFLRGRVVFIVGRRIMNDIRMKLYDRFLRLSMKYHNDNSAGSMIQRLMSDTNAILQLMTEQAIQIAQDLVIFLFSMGVCFWLAWQLAALLCVIILLYVLAFHFFASHIERNTKLFRGITDQIAGRLQETLNGVRQVRIYNREDSEINLFLRQMTMSLDKALASGLSGTGLSVTCNAIANFGTHAINCAGAYMVIRHWISYGDLVATGTYIWMALGPALRLTTIAGQLAETGVSMQRIFSVLEEPLDIVSPADAKPLVVKKGHVEFRDIDFAYTPDKPLFRRFSLDVQPGEMVALVGHTGCGKTTLTSLLMRYWDVQHGSILIDGQDIRAVELASLQAAFGVVLQEPVVFEGTFFDNIAYGTKNPSREAVLRAAEAAELEDTIHRLPDGLDTRIGTYGVKLSVGEKQRVNIARAILRNPAILVMDEATSALDSESESLIQKAFSRLLSGRTSFVVAHRLSTITGANRIVVLDEGRIVEMGTHDELMDIPDGAYRALYEELRRSGADEPDGAQ